MQSLSNSTSINSPTPDRLQNSSHPKLPRFTPRDAINSLKSTGMRGSIARWGARLKEGRRAHNLVQHELPHLESPVGNETRVIMIIEADTNEQLL